MKKLYVMDICSKKSLKEALKTFGMALLLLANVSGVYAQDPSGEWDSYIVMTPDGGSPNVIDHGNGVFQLMNSPSKRLGSAVLETSVQYNTGGGGNFSHCYYVYFGCPGLDFMGKADAGPPDQRYLDTKGDGMAFSFYSGTYTNNANASSGGLGYMNANQANTNKMITVEFDTYSNYDVDDFDGAYGGGVWTVAGNNHDEISLHVDGEARDSGIPTTGIVGTTSVDAGNLEDGEEHYVCISYVAATRILSVTLDNNPTPKLSVNLGPTYNLNTYFSGGSVNQAWSAGQYGAIVPAIVSDGTHTIASQVTSVGGGCATLPVSWLSFTGKKIGGAVVLDWATATEKNNNKFIVERSSSISDWVTIGEVVGSGNSSSVKNYSFTDQDLQTGTVYYRIRQVDVDGKFDYSKVVAVQTSGEPSVSIAPNPFSDALTIRSSEAGEITVKILDILGREVYQTTKETADGILVINPELLSGTYIITIQTDTFIDQQKIIKN